MIDYFLNYLKQIKKNFLVRNYIGMKIFGLTQMAQLRMNKD